MASGELVGVENIHLVFCARRLFVLVMLFRASGV